MRSMPLLCNFVDTALHVESRLRFVIMFAIEYLSEPLYRVRERDVLSWLSGENFCDEERLREETLHFAGASDDELIFIREFVHAENRDDILEVLVPLQNLLNATRHAIVLRPDDLRIKDNRTRIERIDSRIDRELSERTREHDGRIKMREGRRRRGIGQVGRRDIHSLHGRD